MSLSQRGNHIYPITDTRTNKEHNKTNEYKIVLFFLLIFCLQHSPASGVSGYVVLCFETKTKTKKNLKKTRFSRFVSLYFLIDRSSLIYSVLFVSFWTLVVVSAMKSLLRSYNAPRYTSLFLIHFSFSRN